jgi:hypothetical protein
MAGAMDGMDAGYRASRPQRFGDTALRYTQRALLVVMCAAREPLAVRELAQILGAPESPVLAV